MFRVPRIEYSFTHFCIKEKEKRNRWKLQFHTILRKPRKIKECFEERYYLRNTSEASRNNMTGRIIFLLRTYFSYLFYGRGIMQSPYTNCARHLAHRRASVNKTVIQKNLIRILSRIFHLLETLRLLHKKRKRKRTYD